MARLILCRKCYARMKANAEKYGEYCHGLEGTALKAYQCDGAGGEAIAKGDICVAADLFPRKPEEIELWHTQFIDLAPTQDHDRK